MRPWTIGKAATLTDLGMCINYYRLQTVGLYACINVGVKIGHELLYPDMMVMINSGRHKQCEPDFENDYFSGPPNFILDIHENPKSQFVKDCKELFATSGVEEYLILNEALTSIEWNRLAGDKFVKIKPDKEGMIKSSSLPGLWIPFSALQKRDWWSVMASIDQGITRREHHDFMNSIWK